MAASNNAKCRLGEPINSRALSTGEEIIIWKASKLHGSIFHPWPAQPSLPQVPPGSKYEDPTSFHMSVKQAKILKDWQRAGEMPGKSLNGCLWTSILDAKRLKPLDLVQDVTTDCSVVASLCAITSRTERGFPDVFSTIFHPWDREKDGPATPSSGQYVLRYYFNGTYRRVIIDDRLPISTSERKLYVIDRNDDRVLWPALVEKAYLKVRGGYDFPGSNSGTDVWILTGWIPEQLFLHRYGFERLSRSLRTCRVMAKLLNPYLAMIRIV